MEKLDRFSSYLAREGLEFYSKLDKKRRSSKYTWLKSQFERHFDVKVSPRTMRRKLNGALQREGESLEKFVSRIQEMTDIAYKGMTADLKASLEVDVFLAGCAEKKACILVLHQNPATLEKAYQMVNASIHGTESIIKNARNSSVKTRTLQFFPGKSYSEESVSDPERDRKTIRSVGVQLQRPDWGVNRRKNEPGNSKNDVDSRTWLEKNVEKLTQALS